MPLYLKSHSFGEFVFDFSWAEAYAQAGLNYYPKLVSAIPFTPANGPRIISAKSTDNVINKQLFTALTELTTNNGLSSAHVLYADEATQRSLNEETSWLPRTSCDFHWINRGYQVMEDFFEQFRADKRKKAKRERRRVEEQGISFRTLHGNEMTRELCNVVFSFSEHTFNEHGHEHYLNAEFFHRVAQSLPQSMMVKLAEFQGEAVAAAVFFRSDDTLFGRYWGSAANFHSLHFETCYYQGIEYCIEHGLKKFEPGTQGEHKVPRGFEPTLTHSYHFIRDQRFRSALRHYLQRERDAVSRYATEMRDHVPFHRQHVDTNMSPTDAS
jgi:predicted N-acyltransferase